MSRVFAITALLVVGAGCSAHQLGANATRGALEHLNEHSEARRSDPEPTAERVGRGIVKGILAQLDTPQHRDELSRILQQVSASLMAGVLAEADRPEQLEQLRQLAREAASSALRELTGPDGSRQGAISVITEQIAHGASTALSQGLGTNGDGPLARSLNATAEQVSASAVRGIREEVELFPECRGSDRRRCIDNRLTELSRAAALGVRDGIRGMLEVPLLVLAFLVGSLVALVISRMWVRRSPPPRPVNRLEPSSSVG